MDTCSRWKLAATQGPHCSDVAELKRQKHHYTHDGWTIWVLPRANVQFAKTITKNQTREIKWKGYLKPPTHRSQGFSFVIILSRTFKNILEVQFREKICERQRTSECLTTGIARRRNPLARSRVASCCPFQT